MLRDAPCTSGCVELSLALNLEQIKYLKIRRQYLRGITRLSIKINTATNLLVLLFLTSHIYTAALSNLQFASFNDCDDRNDIVTPQKSQKKSPNIKYKSHIDAISAGIYPDLPSQTKVLPQPKHSFNRSLISTSSLSCEEKVDNREGPHKALHVTRNTLSAILYAVEALRAPHPFTPDLLEETASMSTQVNALPSSSRQVSENELSRCKTIPGSSSSVKGPREVMRERAAREARRKAELEHKEALERIRATEEAISLVEKQINDEKLQASDFVQDLDRNQGENNDAITQGLGQVSGQRITSNTREEKKGETLENNAKNTYSHPSNKSAKQGQASSVGDNFRGPKTRLRQPEYQTKLKQTDPIQSHQSAQVGGRSAVLGTRSSFPHAFERWETLSAHWEGLTSFWIRRLEENGREVERDPLLQQLSRQVTDLSAAGANLFHAVVELQRLRASSERKFQRWFFETRTEQERNREIQASIERKFQNEVEARAAAVAQAASEERERLNAEQQLAEAKRELQISKDEAKRAWEELGRREKEERERTTSLREGLPTVIGGVEVVPMITGTPSRSGTTRRTEYISERSDTGRDCNPPNESIVSNTGYSQRSYDVSDSYQDTSNPRRTPVASNLKVANTNLNETSFCEQIPGRESPETSFFKPAKDIPISLQLKSQQPASESLGSSSDQEEDHYEIDSQEDFASKSFGNLSTYQPEADYTRGSEQYDNEIDRLRQYSQIPEVEYGRGIQVTADYLHNPGSYSVPNIDMDDAADYTDLNQQCYSSGSDWANVPRHHHPTRLSDVMEEDERSRTSASQMSRSRD